MYQLRITGRIRVGYNGEVLEPVSIVANTVYATKQAAEKDRARIIDANHSRNTIEVIPV